MVNTNRDYEPLGDNTFQILNHSSIGDGETITILHIRGYKNNAFHQFLYHLFAILFLGIPYIIYSWYTSIRILKYKKCSLKNANIILLNDDSGQSYILEINCDSIPVELDLDVVENKSIRYFVYQHVKYIWENDDSQFVPLKLPYESLTLTDIIENSNGLTISAQQNALKLYGFNAITIDVKSYFKLLIDEVFNPFYLFQIFSITLWSFDQYYIYAGCILFLSIVSIVTSLYETKKQSLALHDLVESSKCKFVQICRRPLLENITEQKENNDCNVETIDCDKLAPDDLILLPSEGCVMPCDVVLLTGLCIVNESMLTGESVPVTKIPPVHSEEIYNVDIHKRHTIFAGTQVIQTRFYGGSKVIARVLRTGFHTSKGELIKSILYPKPTGLQFYKDSMKFVLFLSIIATMGMVYCIYLYAERRANLKEIFIRALDIITIVVPPALPAAMTVGTIYSQNRLKKLNIYCISPPRINVCGKLKLICFDKTGTLTQDGLEFYGVLAKNDSGQFDDLIQEPWHCLKSSDAIVHGMATCHSLTCIDNQLTGDPLDLSMFEATKWVLEEPGEENQRYDMLAPTVVKPSSSPSFDMEVDEFVLPCEIGILRQFPFSSTQQCMSVICRKLGARSMTIFAKGAPERIQAMCLPASLPDNFAEVLASYAASGYRVIAMAHKQLHRKVTWRDALKMKRNMAECDLQCLGLIIMQNALKPETIPVINELHSAQVRTVMITGDNIMTAISVARNCGMVLPNETIIVLKECCCSDDSSGQPKISIEVLGSSSTTTTTTTTCHRNVDCILQLHEREHERVHLALDGKTWSILKTCYAGVTVSRVVRHGTIFARFRPEQKTQLVQELQALDYVVGMCGDGANDCGALRAAHIGVSLSQAEASIAAPFTSAVQDIKCVKHLILEGRCALVTSFAVFKYMAMYSLIQFFTILILYKRYTTLGNMQFLYIDLVITTSLAVTMGYQSPASSIYAKRPTGSLMSLINLIPLMMQVSLCALVQYASLYYLTLQPWFKPLLKSSYVDEEVVVCWENTVVFCISCYQYVILACVYSKGHPYRKSILTNGLLILTCIILIVFTTILLVYPVGLLAEYFEMVPFAYDKHIIIFRAKLLVFPVLHSVLAFSIEILIGQRKYFKHIVHFIVRKKVPKNKYKHIEKTVNVHQWLDICSH